MIKFLRSEFFADIMQRLGASNIIRKVLFAEPLYFEHLWVQKYYYLLKVSSVI